MKLTLNIYNKQKQIPVNRRKIKKIAQAVLKSGKNVSYAEINFFFTNDQSIKKLNTAYLGENNPTDVIAFNLSNTREKINADIAISAASAARNAKIYKTSALYELYLYAAHGMLHILGYNDNTASKQKIMQRKAEQILSKLSLRGSASDRSNLKQRLRRRASPSSQ